MSFMWNMRQWILRTTYLSDVSVIYTGVQRVIKDQENGNRTRRLTLLGLEGKRCRTNSCNRDHMEVIIIYSDAA